LIEINNGVLVVPLIILAQLFDERDRTQSF